MIRMSQHKLRSQISSSQPLDSSNHTPATKSEPSISQLLAGDDASRRALWEATYRELREVACRQLAGEAPIRRNHATSLVHNAFLRLTKQDARAWTNRAEYLAAAANIMREIRVDDARKRKRLKRGGGKVLVPLLENSPEAATAAGQFGDDPEQVLGVHEVLDQLAAIEPRLGRIVELRFFAGMTVPEVAAALDLAPRTVDNDWRAARAWLFRALSSE
jgi:RNA polymerase sigma factor (TIGR02999 family)